MRPELGTDLIVPGALTLAAGCGMRGDSSVVCSAEVPQQHYGLCDAAGTGRGGDRGQGVLHAGCRRARAGS